MRQHDIHALRAVQLRCNRIEQLFKGVILRAQNRQRVSRGQCVHIIRIDRCRLRVNLIMRKRTCGRSRRRPMKECRMHVTETLHLADRHALLDEGLLCIHDLMGLDVAELLDKILADGVQFLPIRQALDKAAQTSLPRLYVVTEHSITVLLEGGNHLCEINALHRRTARDRHDAPHHVERDGIRDLLEADLRHDLPHLWILLHQFGNALLQIQCLFHNESPFIPIIIFTLM